MDANLVYDEKLSELQVYRQYLENWLRKNEGAVQENKMKTLYDLVSGRKRSNIDTLLKCEGVLQKLQPNAKYLIARHGSEIDSPRFTSPISFDEGSSSPLVSAADGPQGSSTSSERSHNKPSRRSSVSRDRYERSSSVYGRQDGPSSSRRSDQHRSAERPNSRDAQPEFEESRSRSATLRIRDRRSSIDVRDRKNAGNDYKRSSDRKDSKVADHRHAADRLPNSTRSKSTARSSARSTKSPAVRSSSRDRQRKISPDNAVYEPPVTRKSEVFKRLGTKVPPKHYDNLSIELHKESTTAATATSSKTKTTSKSPIDLETIDSSNMNALLQMRSELASEIGSLSPTKTVAPSKAKNVASIVSLVQQAMAGRSKDGAVVEDRPVSPTALLAVQQVMAKQTKTAANAAVAVEERLAQKYSPKPRWKSKTSRDLPLLPTPQSHRKTTPTVGADVTLLPTPQPPSLLPTPAEPRDPRLSLVRRKSISAPCSASLPSLVNSPLLPRPTNVSGHSQAKSEARQQTYGEYCRAREHQHDHKPSDSRTQTESTARRIAHDAKPATSATDTSLATEMATKKKKRWDVPPLVIADDDAAAAASVTPSGSASIARSQFDDIYRVNNYGRTVGSVTHMNANINQHFKIPKKKSTGSSSSSPSSSAFVDRNTDVVPMDIDTLDDVQLSPEPTATKATAKPRPRTISIDSPGRRDPRLEARKQRELDATGKTSPLASDKSITAEEVTSTSMAAAAAAVAAAATPSVVSAPLPETEVSSSSSMAADPKKTPSPIEELPNRLVESMLVDMQQLSKEHLLAMLSKALELDESKVGKIQQILAGDDQPDTPSAESKASSSAAAAAAAAAENPEPPAVKPRAKPAKRLNELQKLNEDIRTMFISDGVLTATGRRMCTTAKPAAASTDDEKTTRRKTLGTKSHLVEDSPPAARVMRRRNTVCVSHDDTVDTRGALSSRKQPKTAAVTNAASTRKSHRARKRASSDGEQEDVAPAIKIKPIARKSTATTDHAVASDDDDDSPLPRRRQLRSSNPLRMEKVRVVLAKMSVEQMIDADRLSSAKERTAAAPAASLDDAIILKNTDKHMHALNGDKNRHCLLCEYRGPHLILHYANDHPNAENYLARVPIVMGDQLHTVKGLRRLARAERIENSKLRQQCIFCVDHREFTYTQWLSHYSGHTGEMMYECFTCGHLTSVNKHICNTSSGKMQRRELPQFDRTKLTAFVCRLCNYTQFERDHVVRHLINQHGLDKALVATGSKMTEVDCMRFDCEASLSRSLTNRKRHSLTAAKGALGLLNVKREKVDDEVFTEKVTATALAIKPLSKKVKSEPATTDTASTTSAKRTTTTTDFTDSDSDVAFRRHTRTSGRLTRLAKRRKSHRMLDDDDDTEDFPDQSELEDNMRLMDELPFGRNRSGNKSTPPPTETPARTTSMADRLNERFKSARKDAVARKCYPSASSALRVDAGLANEAAALADDDDDDDGAPPLSPTGQALLNKFELVQHLYKDVIPIEMIKPLVDDATDPLASEPETPMRTPARPKKTAIAKTPLVIEASPAVLAGSQKRPSQPTPMDVDVDEISLIDDDDEDAEWEDCTDEDDDDNAATTTPAEPKPSTLLLCDESLGDDAIAMVPSLPPQKPHAVPSTSAVMSPPAAPAAAATVAVVPQKNNTIVDIVNRLSQSISFARTTTSASSMPLTTSLTLPMPTNVVYCRKTTAPVPRIDQVKTINRIDNIGYSVFNNRTGFCCLIDGCGFESAMPFQLSSHLNHHETPWSGYCFMCDKQIHNMNCSLSFELKHMQTVHVMADINKALQIEPPKSKPPSNVAAVDTVLASRPNLVVRRLPGDQLSTLKSPPAAAVSNKTTTTGGGIQIGRVISLAKPQMQTQSVSMQQPRMFTISKVTNGAAVVSAMQPVSAALKITNVISLSDNVVSSASATAVSTTPMVACTKPSPIVSAADIAAVVTDAIVAKQLLVPPALPRLPVKPWTTSTNYKFADVQVEMLRHKCLFALHKCMSPECSFTNQFNNLMLAHLRQHERTAFDVNVSPGASLCRPWLECAYCQLVASSADALVMHVDTEHRSSIFQCSHCFYRSCAAHNVMLHQDAIHAQLPKGVLVCLGRPRALSVELPLIIASRALHVRQLQCDRDCKKRFYTIETYRQHMLESKTHGDQIVCPLCLKTVRTGMTLAHQLHVHGIGRYACVYCPFGISEVAKIHEHMWREHPSKLPYVACRVRRVNVVQKTTTKSNVDSLDETVLAYVGNTVNKQLFTRCDFNEEELSQVSIEHLTQMSAELNSTASTAATASHTLEIVGVNSISKESFNATSADSLISDVTGQTISFDHILNIADVEAYFFKHELNEPWRRYLSNPPKVNKTAVKKIAAIAAKPAIVPVRVVAVNGIPCAGSSATTATEPLNATPAPSTSTAAATVPATMGRHNELVQQEIDNAAFALVRDTGLEGRDLYRCADVGCSATAIDQKEFNVHLMKHAANVDFPCQHCDERPPNIIGLLLHLRQQHARHQHFCYYCDYTGHGAKDLVKHMKVTHKKQDLTYVLLNPNKRTISTPVVVCPRGIAPTALWQFGLNLVERFKRGANKTSFTPAEVGVLPRAAILSQPISCAQCQYATKVRTNMVRHLAACKGPTAVTTSARSGHAAKTTAIRQLHPPSDPVNPMPCLDTPVRHFDKMRNLAGSSNETGGVALDLVSSFVPEKDRYVCNASGCRYQTINESMLSNHLMTLHASEPNYSCPHCTLNLGSVDVARIVDHLRLHGSRLYKCNKCMFHSSSRATVDAHVSLKHAEAITLMLERSIGTGPVISAADTPAVAQTSSNSIQDRRGSTTTTASESANTSLPVSAPPQKLYKWVCMMCTESFATRPLIRMHALRVHSISSQYQCEECKMQFVAKRAVEVHMTNEHPDSRRLAKYFYARMESEETTPIWRRDDPLKVKHIRGILFEDEEATKPVAKRKSKPKPAKRISMSSETDDVEIVDDNKEPLIVVSDDEPETVAKPPECGPSDALKGAKTYAVKSSVPSPVKAATVVRVKNKRVGSDLAIMPITSVQPGVKTEKQVSYTYNCKHCMKRMTSIDLLYKHWQEAHKYRPKGSEQLNESEPFIFYVDIHLRCGLCPNFSRIPKRTYRIHNARIHPNREIAMTEMNDSSQCGICEFNSSDKDVLDAHFKSAHAFASQDDQSLMNRPLVPISEHNLRHLQFSGHQGRHKCLYCNEVLSYKEDFEKHHQIQHAKMPPLMQVLAETPRYACTICELLADTEQDVVQHLQHHNMYKFQKKYQCVHCETACGSKVGVRDHCVAAHGFNTNEWRLTPIETRLGVYERIKIIFPNGLMVCKAEVPGTKWGDMSDIIREIGEIEALELAEQYIFEPERNKRKHGQLELETTDPTKATAPSTSTMACDAEPRRQVARRSFPLPPLSQPQTTTAAPEEAWYSFYGEPPSTVDLKKVMTYITNGATQVRLSCDQYAKFVNIAPELQLEKVRPEDYPRRASDMDQSP